MPGMEVFWLVRVVCGHAAAALASAGLAGADWARLADGGEEQQVVRDAGEEELTGDGWQAAREKRRRPVRSLRLACIPSTSGARRL